MGYPGSLIIGRAIRFMLEQPDHVAIPRMLVMPADQGM
jgi:NADP-dependent 3-hydroxy acid dehydrogenase YdfG